MRSQQRPPQANFIRREREKAREWDSKIHKLGQGRWFISEHGWDRVWISSLTICFPERRGGQIKPCWLSHVPTASPVLSHLFPQTKSTRQINGSLICQEPLDVYCIQLSKCSGPFRVSLHCIFGGMAGVKSSTLKSDRYTWFVTWLFQRITGHLLSLCGNSQRRNKANSSTNSSLKGSGTEGQFTRMWFKFWRTFWNGWRKGTCLTTSSSLLVQKTPDWEEGGG